MYDEREEACAGRSACARQFCARDAACSTRTHRSSFASLATFASFATFDRRYRSTTRDRGAFGARLLRLPFQPDQMAVVQPGRSRVMAGRPGRRAGAQGTQFFGVALVLPADAKAKASVDGPRVARALDATVGLPPDAS